MTFRMIILLAAIWFNSIITFAQEADAFLTRFFAVQLDESVLLRWTMGAGNTCEDTYIERSGDGVSYQRIGLIGGICGSPDEEITFEYNDTLPLVNQTAYYRLMLGYFGYTSPKIIEFVRYNDKGYFIGPNPFSDFTRIAFENDDNEEYHLLISDVQGRIVLEMMTTGNEFIIRREELGSGVYIVIMIKENMVFNHIKLIAE